MLLQQPLSIDLSQQAQAQELSGSATTFGEFISRLMGGVMLIAALLLLLYLIWGAVEWITSGGDSGKVSNARNKMTQAVIGIIVLSATLAIFGLVQNFLGLDYFRIQSSGSSVRKSNPANTSATSGSTGGTSGGSSTLNNSGNNQNLLERLFSISNTGNSNANPATTNIESSTQ